MPKKKDLTDYFKSIGLTARPYVQRVEQLLAIMEQLAGQEIETLIVEDAFDAEGNREYLHLAGFTAEGLLVGADNFLNKDDIMLWSVKDRVWWLEFISNDYDYKNAGDDSRLRVELRYRNWSEGIYTLSGAGRNCDFVLAAVEKYVRPYMAKA